jgi:hypothetical protein
MRKGREGMIDQNRIVKEEEEEEYGKGEEEGGMIEEYGI